MRTAAAPPVYFFVHIPKTAGTTLEDHLRAHMPRERLWMPSPSSAMGMIGKRRYRVEPLPDLASIRAVIGGWMGRSLESLFPGREIRRTVLLRDPIGLHVSLYNYRMFHAVASGRPTMGFERHLRQMPRDLVALLILAVWLEMPISALLRTSDERKFELLNEALADFWFVGSYRDCDQLIAAVADDLEVPRTAVAKNTSSYWERRVDWRPLRADDLATDMRAAILARNPIDDALWRTWHAAGFAASRLCPRPLSHQRWGLRGLGKLHRAWLYVLQIGVGELDRELLWGPAAHAAQGRDWRTAVALYVEVLRQLPRFPEIWVQYGHCLGASGDIVAAETAYRRAIELDPRVGEVHLHFGHVLTLLHRDQEAAAAYRRCAQLDPVRWQQWRDKLVASGHLRVAVAEDRSGFKEEPCTEPMDQSASVFPFAQSDKFRPQRLIAKSLGVTLRRKTWKQEHTLRQADAARNAKQYREAAALYEKFLALSPDDAAIHIQCGHMLKESGDLARAESHYERAKQLTPDDPELALQFGHFYKLAGRLGEAERAYRRAIELAPDWPEPADELGMLYRA
jgi:Flp pilus assembly protein TadD